MPYDRSSSLDRDKIAKRLARYWPDGVPDRAVDQYAEVFNRVLSGTGDEGLAFASAAGVAKRRSERQHAACCGDREPQHASAAVEVGRALASTMSRRVLQELRGLAEHCDCGKDHQRTLTALRHALAMADGQGIGHAKAEADYEAADVGVNVRMVWEMIARDIYAQGDRVFLAVREMLQNSRDARAKNIQITWENDPGSPNATLTFTDDGKGMDRRIVQKKFMVIGESEKEEGALGGFGAAKAAILTASTTGWSWDLRTRNVHAHSLPNGRYAIADVADYFPGARITIPDMANAYMRSPIGSGVPVERIVALLSTSDLRGLNVTVNGQPVGSYFEGRRGRAEEGYEKLNWGPFSVSIKSYRRESGEEGAIIMRVKGLSQFAVAAPYGSHFDRDWVVDFDIPKEVTPQSPGYPFKAGRDSFRYGGSAYEAFERMRDSVVQRAVSGEKDLGEYMEIAPDSTDPREQKAEAQFTSTIESVMSSDAFQETLRDLGELTREMQDAIVSAIGTDPNRAGEEEADYSERPGGHKEHGGRRTDPVVQLADEVLRFQSDLSAIEDPAEQLDLILSWSIGRLAAEDTVGFEDAVYYLKSGHGSADDLQKLAAGVTEAMKRAAPDASDLVIASVVSRVVDRFTARMPAAQQEEVARRKKRGDLNPFGGAACIFVNRSNYGVDRYKKFKARKYMKHLAWWDFTVRAVIKALGHTGQMARNAKVGIGFVLDDKVLGLCRQDGQFVMVNPEPLEAVIGKFKDRGYIPASYIHGIACHELAHANQISMHSNSSHNEVWSIDREHFASATLFLLPAIEEAGVKLLGLKKRHRIRKPKPEVAPDVQAMQQVAALETALAEAKLHLETAQQEREEATRLLTSRSEVLHQLEDLVRVHEFRHWVRQNPALLPEGVTFAQFLDYMDSPSGVERLMVRMGRDRAGQIAQRLKTLEGPEASEAPAAYHAACACTGIKGYEPGEEKPMRRHAKFTGGLSAPYRHFPHDLLRAMGVPKKQWPALINEARAAVARGKEVELEHTDDLHEAAKIARDHLVEWFRDHGNFAGYYEELDRMERTGHAAARRSSKRDVCPPTSGKVTARGYPKSAAAWEKAKTAKGTKAGSRGWRKVAQASLAPLQRYGVEISKQLGCGTFACAYALKGHNSLIAKFSGDAADAAAWERVRAIAKRRRRWPSGLAKVECVEALPGVVPPEAGKESNRRVFLMLQERMSPLSEEEEEFYSNEAITRAILDGDVEVMEAHAYEWDIDPDEVIGIAATVEWLRDHGIVWHDLHGGNVMRGIDGQLKIMDLGYSEVPATEVRVLDEHAACPPDGMYGGHAALKHAGKPPYKDHFICYTDEDIDEIEGDAAYYQKRAKKLAMSGGWAGFDELKVVCLDESDPDDPTVAGVTAMNGEGELLFVVDPEYRNQRVAQLMVEAMLPEVAHVTEEEVLSGAWYPPYSAVAGSEGGLTLLSSLPNRYGWRVFALISWSGYEEEMEAWRHSRHAKLSTNQLTRDLLTS